jgi:hypothetical protein
MFRKIGRSITRSASARSAIRQPLPCTMNIGHGLRYRWTVRVQNGKCPPNLWAGTVDSLPFLVVHTIWLYTLQFDKLICQGERNG